MLEEIAARGIEVSVKASQRSSEGGEQRVVFFEGHMGSNAASATVNLADPIAQHSPQLNKLVDELLIND